ncbi:MAG: hypothetical protein WBU92_07360, partial [Candidatus Dormiibacterota bacterium]
MGGLAIGVGTVLLAGARPITELASTATQPSTLGMQLAGVRDVAIGIAMVRPGDGMGSKRLARVAAAIQIGDLAVVLLQWRRGLIRWPPVVGV